MRRFFLLFFLLSLNLHLVFAYNNESYPVITSENVMNLQEIEVLGTGAMYPALAWSPDGSRFVVGGMRGLYVYEDLNAEPEFIELGSTVSSLRFSPDGSLLFASFDGKLNAFELESRTIRYSLEGSRVLAISSDGRLLAYSADMAVHVAEIETGAVQTVLDYSQIWQPDYQDEWGTRFTNAVFAQFINEQENLIVYWNGEENGRGSFYEYGRSDLWNLATAQLSDSRAYYGWENFAAYDAEGNAFWIDTAGYLYRGERRLAALHVEESQIAPPKHSAYILAGNLLAAPMCIVNEVSCRETGSTAVWDIRTGTLIAQFEAFGNKAFSPDGSRLAIGNRIFELETGVELARLQADTYQVLDRLPERILHYRANGEIGLLDMQSRETIAVLPLLRHELHEQPYKALEDGSFLLQHRNRQLVIRVDGTTGTEIARFESASLMNLYSPLYTSPQLEYFAASLSPVDANGKTHALWDADTGEEIILPDGYVLAPSSSGHVGIFHPDGGILVWDSTGRQLLIYNPETSEILHSFPFEGELTHRYPWVLLSVDGQSLLLGSSLNSVLWSIETHSILLSIDYEFYQPMIHQNYAYLTFVSEENGIEIYEVATGEFVTSVEAWGVGGITFVSQTMMIVSGNDFDVRDFAYDLALNAELEMPEESNAPTLLLEWNGIRIQRQVREMWFENAEGEYLSEFPIGENEWSIGEIPSEDGKYLYINYYDGTIGIWAVPE